MKLFTHILYLIAIGLLMSCSPINYFTHLKKTPREYSYNYCISSLKAPKSAINKTAWVVYSDRDKNSTTLYPGGKLKCQDLKYLQPLLVISEKHGYLKVVKYDPAIIKNGKLDNKKAAEFYGWIHQSKLILNNQSVTDTHSGLKNKNIIAIADTSTITHPELYIEDDSVKIFKTPRLVECKSKVGLYSIVYLIKRDSDKRKILIANTPYLTPDNIEASVIGWVHTNLVQNIGQQLFVNKKTTDSLNQNLSNNSKPIAMNYNPVLKQNTELHKIKTADLYPVVDRSENRIFNVNGNPITFKEIAALENRLHRINVVFLIEPGEKTIEQLPLLMNAFQSIHAIMNDPLGKYSFQYASVTSSLQNKQLTFNTVPFTQNFEDITSNLLSLSKNEEVKAIGSSHAWKGLYTCMQLIEKEESATNIVITFGEQGRPYDWDNTFLAENAAKLNCRFFGYQIYSGNTNMYNNFINQYSNLIENTAKKIAPLKKENIVYSDQVTAENKFVEWSKNYFTLDFPSNSMTQGGIAFPEKDQMISYNQVIASIDSLFNQIKTDNELQIKSFNKAFMSSGHSKDKYDSSFQTRFHLEKDATINPLFYKSFQTYPLWFNKQIDSTYIDSTMQYQLLLSEQEYEDIRSVFEKIADIEVDTKQISKSSNKKEKRSCDCPDSDFLIEDYNTSSDNTDSVKIKYRSTRKARAEFSSSLLSQIHRCPVCKNKTLKIKKLSLAQLHEEVFHAPCQTALLDSISVKDILHKRKLSDSEFEQLLNYYKSQKEILEAEVSPKISFTSFSETYFWVNTLWLP